MREDIIKEALFLRFGIGSDAGQIADAIRVALRLLHAELALVVGAQASAALVAHAVHRTRTVVNWTMPAAAALTEAMLAALREDLAARTPADSLFAGETLIFALVDHLISLIGEPLTFRMLNLAWAVPGADQSPQEIL
ncbi:hypothetical protein ACSFA8_09775 [Variovorax sp. RT4R15]|uniref:hypothetical protein n=1 Tax=Variovorax sp. RT4R15 TaxID=3443737 RepID=UPI003F45C6F3